MYVCTYIRYTLQIIYCALKSLIYHTAEKKDKIKLNTRTEDKNKLALKIQLWSRYCEDN